MTDLLSVDIVDEDFKCEILSKIKHYEILTDLVRLYMEGGTNLLATLRHLQKKTDGQQGFLSCVKR